MNRNAIRCQRNLALGVKTADEADSRIIGLEELILLNDFISYLVTKSDKLGNEIC